MAKASKTAPRVAFDAVRVFNGARNIAASRRDLVAYLLTLRKLDLEKAQRAFYCGEIAGRLFTSDTATDAELMARADAIIAMKGHAAKGGDGRRTETQEKAYTAARVAWSRLTADHDSLRVGVQGKRKGKHAPDKADKPAPAVRVAKALEQALDVAAKITAETPEAERGTAIAALVDAMTTAQKVEPPKVEPVKVTPEIFMDHVKGVARELAHYAKANARVKLTATVRALIAEFDAAIQKACAID